MKTLLMATLSLTMAANVFAQTRNSKKPIEPPPAPSQVKDTPYAVVDRDANSRVWERRTYERTPTGELLPNVHRYQELATGLHYKDPQTGKWVESKEQIDILPQGGAAATHGQHQVYFPSDIYDGVIELVTPDG